MVGPYFDGGTLEPVSMAPSVGPPRVLAVDADYPGSGPDVVLFLLVGDRGGIDAFLFSAFLSAIDVTRLEPASTSSWVT